MKYISHLLMLSLLITSFTIQSMDEKNNVSIVGHEQNEEVTVRFLTSVPQGQPPIPSQIPFVPPLFMQPMHPERQQRYFMQQNNQQTTGKRQAGEIEFEPLPESEKKNDDDLIQFNPHQHKRKRTLPPVTVLVCPRPKEQPLRELSDHSKECVALIVRAVKKATLNAFIIDMSLVESLDTCNSNLTPPKFDFAPRAHPAPVSFYPAMIAWLKKYCVNDTFTHTSNVKSTEDLLKTFQNETSHAFPTNMHTLFPVAHCTPDHIYQFSKYHHREETRKAILADPQDVNDHLPFASYYIPAIIPAYLKQLQEKCNFRKRAKKAFEQPESAPEPLE